MLFVPIPRDTQRHFGSSGCIASSVRHTPPPAAPTQRRHGPTSLHCGEIARAETRPEKFALPSKLVIGPRLDQVASLFEGSVNDVVKTLIVNGYGREQELAADKGAMIYMHRLGYDPRGLIDYLAKLANEQRTGADRGFFATHPDMAQRLFIARSFLGEKNWSLVNHHVRDRRFSHYRKML